MIQADIVDRFYAKVQENSSGCWIWNGSKLNKNDVLEIRKLYKKGIPIFKLAEIFPVTRHAISLIVRRINWSHI